MQNYKDLAPKDAMTSLLEVMRALRDPDNGCPWDLEQDYRSIVPHTIEEAYEVADAIEREDFKDLVSELGDLLFQVVFYAQLAEEEKRFNFADVAEAITDKLIRRHPHVFHNSEALTSEEQTEAWEQQKAEERNARASANNSVGRILDDIPAALPSLIRAVKIQKRASRVGFDWPHIDGALAKVDEETREVRECLENEDSTEALNHELGDLLFSVVNVARMAGVNPERALSQANHRFIHRFRHIEDRVTEAGSTIENQSLDQLEVFWREAKSAIGKGIPGKNP